MEKLLLDRTDVSMAPANFVHMYAHTMYDAEAKILDFDSAISMRSYIYRAAGSGTFRMLTSTCCIT
jgi:hypothetical protein